METARITDNAPRAAMLSTRALTMNLTLIFFILNYCNTPPVLIKAIFSIPRYIIVIYARKLK
jgi:hypothetical protein